MIKKFLNWVKTIFSKKPETSESVGEYLANVTPQSEQPLRWKIWMTFYDIDGDITGYGVYATDYAHKSSAVRRAKQLWGDNPLVKWEVSQTNPSENEVKAA